MIFPGVGMTLGAVFIGREQAMAFFCRSPWDLPVMESTRVVEYPVNTATAGLGLIKIGTFLSKAGHGVFDEWSFQRELEVRIAVASIPAIPTAPLE